MLSDVRRELEHLAAVIKRRKKPKFLFSGFGSYRILVGAPLNFTDFCTQSSIWRDG